METSQERLRSIRAALPWVLYVFNVGATAFLAWAGISQIARFMQGLEILSERCKEMANANMISCEFCATLNLADAKNCVSCGAPVTKKRALQPRPSPGLKAGDSFSKRVESTPDSLDLDKARQAGEEVEEVFNKAVYAYSLVWRTLAEAATIAIVGFAVGLVGGATSMAFWGVLGAIILGAAVGFTIKMSYLTLLSAPLGLVIGTVIGIFLSAIGLGPRVFVFSTTIFAVLAAVVGGRGIPYPHRNWYEKARPLLGGLGGLIFGILGMLIGLGLRAGVNALLG
ncbi:MAG: hypothetical protein MUO76_17735 [Anaerolineaceae bacterium]|nr:hypothetical protein [Anaerolineaceae bacterium]